MTHVQHDAKIVQSATQSPAQAGEQYPFADGLFGPPVPGTPNAYSVVNHAGQTLTFGLAQPVQHNGKGNKFYELMTGESKLWDRHTVDIYQAVAEGLPRDIDELREGVDDDDVWAQEYELKWLDGATAWLDYDLINRVEDAAAGLPEHYQGGYCYVGNDIARRNNLWVAWVFEAVGDVLWTREIAELGRATFAEQDATLDTLMERYTVVRLYMDQSGMGEKPVEDAQRRYGESRVEGVTMTQASKLHLATIGKQAFEGHKLRIPAGNRKATGRPAQPQKGLHPHWRGTL